MFNYSFILFKTNVICGVCNKAVGERHDYLRRKCGGGLGVLKKILSFFLHLPVHWKGKAFQLTRIALTNNPVT